MTWKNESCNNDKPACKMVYECKCLPSIKKFYERLSAGKPAAKWNMYVNPSQIKYF